jgi:uncharacterized membrane protein HdeD (DUF308 family)
VGRRAKDAAAGQTVHDTQGAVMDALIRSWWLLALRGVLALVFGLAAIFHTRITLGEFVLLFGLYVVLDGLGSIVSAMRADDGALAGWPLLLEGGVSVALGVIAWVSPRISPTLLFLIATWGIITGILEIVAAVKLPQPSTTQWCLALSGVSSVLIGMLLLGLPAAGVASIIRLLGLYAFVFGGLILAAAFRLRTGRGTVPLLAPR